MLNFAPTEEQEEVRRLAQSIAVEQLRPQGRASEKRGDISPALMQTLAATGLTTPFPEAYGGSGPIEAVTYALIAEELAYGDGALAMNIIGSMMAPVTVTLAGSERDQVYIPLFCDPHSGATQRGSFTFAERTGGYTLADIHATARPADEHYILNGTKRDVIHGGNAQLNVSLFRLEGTSGPDGICAFVLPAQAAGMKVSTDAEKLGLLAAPGASYTFDNVTVPAQALLGEPGSSGVIRAAALYALLRAGIACGTARAAFDYARNYAQERIAFGRPIASYQGIAFIIAEMAMKLDATRLLLWDAAASWDNGVDNETLIRKTDAAHSQAVKIAKSATLDSIQVLGGVGYLQDHPVEMWARNAAAMD